MNPTNNQIRALSQHHGSKERVITESGVTRGTFYNLLKEPHVVHKTSSAKIIYTMFYNDLPTEWAGCANFEEVIRSIDINEVELPSTKYQAFLKNQKSHLMYNQAQGKDSVEGAGVDYCEAKIEYQQRFYLKNSDAPTVDSIDKKMESALKKLSKHAPDAFSLAIGKLIITRYAIFFQPQNKSIRSLNEENKKRLIEDEFIENAKMILNKEPWEWAIARNGIVAASMLEDKENCIFFWEALKSSHKKFEDPSFLPGKVPSLQGDPDLKWFRDNILQNGVEVK